MHYPRVILDELGKMPITVVSRSKAVFARSNTGIVDSNPIPGMDASVYSVFVLFCV
jgi:hypothetical protein